MVEDSLKNDTLLNKNLLNGYYFPSAARKWATNPFQSTVNPVRRKSSSLGRIYFTATHWGRDALPSVQLP